MQARRPTSSSSSRRWEHERGRRADRALERAAQPHLGALSLAVDAAARAAETDAGEPIGADRGGGHRNPPGRDRSEEHTSELQSLMRISYAVFCLTKKKYQITSDNTHITSITHQLTCI